MRMAKVVIPVATELTRTAQLRVAGVARERHLAHVPSATPPPRRPPWSPPSASEGGSQGGGPWRRPAACRPSRRLTVMRAFWRWLQNNRHKLTLSMRPDDQYSEKQMQLETEKLRQKVSSLSSEDKRQVYEKGECAPRPVAPRRLLGRHVRARAPAQPTTGSVRVRMCACVCDRGACDAGLQRAAQGTSRTGSLVSVCRHGPRSFLTRGTCRAYALTLEYAARRRGLAVARPCVAPPAPPVRARPVGLRGQDSTGKRVHTALVLL